MFIFVSFSRKRHLYNSTKNSCFFYCAVALCRIQNAPLAMRNLHLTQASAKQPKRKNYSHFEVQLGVCSRACLEAVLVALVIARAHEIKIKILGSECQTSSTHAKRAKQATKKGNCLCFLNYLVFLRPAADRAVSILPWVVSPGRSYGFLWAGSIIQKHVRKDNPTPAYSPVSDRRHSHGAC
jgi:hypothetical protein